VTAGVKYDVPPGPFGGSEGYAFSPDGKELAYTAKDQGRADAWSTDLNLYTVPVAGGAPVVITAANRGADQNPVYSPDGRIILYASQARAGFESDRQRLMAYDRASRTSRELLPGWDRNADAYAFSPSGDAIYLNTVDASRTKLYRITRTSSGWATGPQLLTNGGNNFSPSVSADGKTIAWLQDATERPAEVYVGTVGAAGLGGIRRLTHENDALLAQLKLNPAEDFWFKGAEGDSVQGLIIRPPQYQAGKKFPVLFLIHGGPQGEWLDQWHGRWNFELFASPGFGIVAINPRGSFGYGQKFTDQISRDWGGRAYTDLMNGLDAALARNNWLDSTRMGAAGGSYGGYMTNWIAGHSNRFKALFTHAGVFNLENMYGATEEIWFSDWEFGQYWNKAAMDSVYRRWSPHLFAGNFHTPHLVVVGELDYRVPYTEGLSLFTALQRQGVPSRLIDFPDEGHWIGKPQNQRLWWGESLGWFTKYLRP
jgi:dipeptidyl aminopeptidase/acylaminoacyl peptidase